MTIQAASINTGNEKRDGHLKSPDFFDVAKFPTLTFVSQSVKPGTGDQLLVQGTLTMHGVSKPVTLTVEPTGVTKDPFGPGTRAGFHATTTIDRKDFGIVWNKAMDNGGLMVGNDVNIEIEIEAAAK